MHRKAIGRRFRRLLQKLPLYGLVAEVQLPGVADLKAIEGRRGYVQFCRNVHGKRLPAIDSG